MGSIELRGVAVGHEDRAVLAGVDLVVPDGEVVALLGRSGSGKTSLLRAVAGLHPVAAGRVLVGGTDVTTVPSRDRGFGMVAQGAPLQPTRDVAGNLRFPLEVRGDTRHDADERSWGQALRFGLTQLLRRRPHQLSTGEQAATAVARAMIRGPAALLLDEPATHLDPQTRAAVLQQVGIVQRTRGTTMLVATNDLGVALALTRTIAVLDRGTLAQVGPLDELRSAPATLDVADLVHAEPLTRLAGRVRRGEGGRRSRVVTAGGDLHTWDARVRDHRGAVVLGLSPRDLRLVGVGGDLQGRVRRVATTGYERLVEVVTDAGLVTVLTTPCEPIPGAGTEVGVAIDRAVVADADGTVLAVVRRP